ncbi:sugar phosphate isomerase/epimerase family protein [Micromonospora haikouensis]|uniref:sugar phosphate isomerase/epimerase family protein n=1 Tax=Micromonospora haikouensis TaxID=686309 RepID=UPI003D7588DB
MRIGIDGRKIPGSVGRGPVDNVRYAHELGMDGIFFRTVLDMTPTLDAGVLRDVRDCADELGLYLEAGLGKVNPYAMAEAPELRAAGDGDTLHGFTRMIAACARVGITELWAGTANYKPYGGRYAYDRFRTDVDWSDQLAATAKFLGRLAPIARDHGVHVNLETHEEITSFEVVRLVEAAGPDTFGIVFDTSNLLQRGEHPLRTAQRVAPYVRQTHIKDAALSLTPDGVLYQERTVGLGVVDLRAILPILHAANPDLTITIENAQPWDEVAVTYPTFTTEQIPLRGRTLVEVFDPAWQAGHPDMSVAELGAYLQLARHSDALIAAGTLPTFDECAPDTFGFDEAVQAARASADVLRTIVAEAGLAG